MFRILSFIGWFCLPLIASAQETHIYRDTWGVPQIHAPSANQIMYGFGYAQAEDRLTALLTNYRMATGQMAAVFGPAYLDHDFQQRLWRHEEAARNYYDTIPPDIRALIESFRAGIQAYMQQHPDRVPKWASIPQPHHIVALARYITFQNQLQQAHNEYAPQNTPPNTGNQWAISPQRSANNTAILCIDPFAQWHSSLRWYEAHLVSDTFKAYGFAIPGLPIFSTGHNQHLGWSALPGGPDCADVYQITLDSPVANRYKYDHTYRPIVTDSVLVAVKTDPTIYNHVRKFQRTHHGPILHRDDTFAYAYRVSLADQVGQIEQAYRMMTAIDLKTFYSALQLAQTGPQRLIYADRYGNIAFLHIGRVPIRSEFYAYNKPISGNTSETEWQGIHTQDDLVQIHNPKTNWLQDCDTDPARVTGAGAYSSDRYPAYIANTPPQASPRANRIRKLLSSSPRMTLSEAVAFSQDTYIIDSEYWIRALNIAISPSTPQTTQQALSILNTWNGRADRNATGSVLYTLWQNHCAQQDRTINTAHILSSQILGNTTLQTLKTTLTATIDLLQTQYNRLNVSHKEIQRFRRGNQSWAIAGSTGPQLTSLRAIQTQAGTHIQNAVSGPSCTTVISFHPSGQVEARSVTPLGQSDDPTSPHYTDQATQLFSQERLKPTQFNISTQKLTLHHTLNAP